MSNKVLAIVQARYNASRLPGKIFKKISGKYLLNHIIDRIGYSKKIDEIVIATTKDETDDKTEKWAKKNNVKIFRGSTNNVLKRFYDCAKEYNADIIVRVTADDPFKDPQIIDKGISILKKGKYDFVYNNKPASYPEGLDTEVFTFKALDQAHRNCNNKFEKEHVTQYFYRNIKFFKQRNFSNKKNLANIRWTIDTEADLKMAKAVYKKLYKVSKMFLMNDILKLLKKYPYISEINSKIPRSEMYKSLN